ncbi:MAG: tRNA dihydrouridine synthase DusB [Desulfobulbaceae bacterium]|jgi:nifR3 family TIM-barrel protein|nr:tRNA dihydrouridine synthase DusB [Desulfobulbaceae bacterium]
MSPSPAIVLEKFNMLGFSSPLLLAPLAGYSDAPFRLLCRSLGAGLCVSEMISAQAIIYRQKKTCDMLRFFAAERPVSLQLFGADPGIMAEAAAFISGLANEARPDFIDLNMGCPVKKVTKKGAGVALMATPSLAETIIRQVCQVTDIAVTVKIRAGINATDRGAVEFAKMAEGAGAKAVAVHGRTWAQQFSGQADWSVVAAVKRALRIPVIGNGDIASRDEAFLRLDESGCDAVMIGRAALKNPFLFHECGEAPLAEIVRFALRHLDLALAYGQAIAPLRMRLAAYFHDFRGSSQIRCQLVACATETELRAALMTIAKAITETAAVNGAVIS